MTTWAIIPARGGSVRIPHKNTRKVDGLTLVEHALASAEACDEIAVSTDDAAIGAICDGWSRKPVHVVPRHDLHATSSAALEPVINHVLIELPVDEKDLIVLLQPTSPRRTWEHVSGAVALYAAQGDAFAGSVVSVCADVKPVAFGGDVTATGVFVRSRAARINTQDLAGTMAYENGAIYITRVRDFLRTNTRMPAPCIAYTMTPRDSIDIDRMDDLGLVRAMGLPGLDEE